MGRAEAGGVPGELVRARVAMQFGNFVGAWRKQARLVRGGVQGAQGMTFWACHRAVFFLWLGMRGCS